MEASVNVHVEDLKLTNWNLVLLWFFFVAFVCKSDPTFFLNENAYAIK